MRKDPDVHAPIRPAAIELGIRGEGLRSASTVDRHPRRVDALFLEELGDGAGASRGELVASFDRLCVARDPNAFIASRETARHVRQFSSPVGVQPTPAETEADPCQ